MAATLAVAVIVIAIPGCVRRTARFDSVPQGARLWLNDRDVGRTPATVDFTWYGDYDVVYRLDGYQTIKTHVAIDPPWYQHFPIDFFAEVLWPGRIHDHHDIPPQELTPVQPPNRDELLERAFEMRNRAGFSAPPPAG